MTGDRCVIARLRRLGISKGKRSRGNLLLRCTENGERVFSVEQLKG